MPWGAAPQRLCCPGTARPPALALRGVSTILGLSWPVSCSHTKTAFNLLTEENKLLLGVHLPLFCFSICWKPREGRRLS